jgi:hypothetical protein
LVNSKYIKRRKAQKRKFRVLCEKEHLKLNESPARPNFVTNKSTQTFSNEEMNLLNKGLKYRPKSKVPPTNEIIVSMEISIRNLSDERKAVIRNGVASFLAESENHVQKNRNEWSVVQKLKEKDCVFLEPDKGKGVVVLDRTSYDESIREHLGGPMYEKVKTKREFPVDTLQEKVRNGLKGLVDDGLMTRRETLSLVVPNPVIPSFSCLPKTHKPGNKIRPVVSNVNTPTSKICELLVKKFRGFERPESRSVKNSLELVQRLESVTIEKDEILVSFDVEALYPSVPVGESSQLLKEWIIGQNISDQEAEICCRLVDIVLEQRWLKYEELLMILKEGLFIGNSLSSILSEVFMGDLEKKMEGKEWFPRMWIRYLDVVFAIVKKGTTTDVLEQLNKQRVGIIKFTTEEEKKGQLPFLDLLLIREGNKIAFEIYRKPTDAPLCIPNDSHHPMSHKLAAFQSVLFRMWAVPLSDRRREKELEYILNMAIINGYKKNSILKLNEKHKRRWRWKNCNTQ